MPNGWRDTFQGRIIFHSLHKGTPLTYQGRYLEHVTDDGLQRYALHPYTLQWDLIEGRATRDQAWVRVAPFDELHPERGTKLWDPAKYKTASNSFRHLMGWDAAIEKADAMDFRYCVLTEGPLDAARPGPGGIALIGKSISAANAIMLVENFQLIITAFDSDTAGVDASKKIQEQLLQHKSRKAIVVAVEPFTITPGKKDIGEMLQPDFDNKLARMLRRFKRMYT